MLSSNHPGAPRFLLCLLVCCQTCLICVGAEILDTDPANRARRILADTGVQGGLIVHLGCGDGGLTAALGAGQGYLVHGLEADVADVRAARLRIRGIGSYGKVSVDHFDGRHLPYADNLVNLLVAEDLGDVTMDEVMRVLSPHGVACVESGATWTKTVKPWPDEIDEWTHYLHDASGNAVADDSVVGPPRHLQWVAGPLYCRSHEWDSSVSALVSAGGRIFYILDEGLTGILDVRLPARWSLVARDAFSGVLLWKRPMPQWGWRQWKKTAIEAAGNNVWRGGQRLQSPTVLPRRLVAAGDRVYVTIGFRAPLSVLDASTGETIATLEGTEGTDEILHQDGVLLLCIREIPATGAERGLGRAPSEMVLATSADTGKLLWQKEEEKILPLSLAALGDRVYFHTYDALVCIDLKTGKELWRAQSAIAEATGTDKRSRRWEEWMTRNTLVARDKVVLFLGPKELRAFSAATGQQLWTAANQPGCGAAQPPDLFVASGLVWSGGLEGNFNTRDPRNALINGLEETLISKEGRDPLSGEVKKTITVRNLIDFGHHFRCYRSKATNRYLLWPKRGVEFLDLEGTNFDRCDWLRPPCRLGTMPSGGLLYVPPHQCFCYPGALLNGFNALAPARPPRAKRKEQLAEHPDRNDRLERGPAYGDSGSPRSALPSSSSRDWPTYRHDAKRSGSAPATVPADVHVAWTAEVGRRLTAPVVADGKVLVSEIDSHTVHCLDAASGEALWSYTVGGPVDSPPTISGGWVLFGSADGRVYCLRASDGQLAWRFRAAPSDRRVVMYDQLTSAWPVHGSVLAEDGVAYFAAGYSSFLDGGIYLYGLDAQTGQTLHEARLDGPHPKIPEEPGWAWDIEGARSEVLVSQGGYIYLRQLKFDKRLQRQETSRITRLGDRDVGLHLFSTSSLLDDSWFNRTFWMYSATWPGYYRANRGASKTGQLLVFDDTTTYGIRVYEHEKVPVPWFVPGAGYRLFADDNDNEPVLAQKAANWDKGPGFARAKPARWTIDVPVRARALVLAGDNLFLAGPPDVIDADDPLAAFEGRKGDKLWAVSAKDGKKLAEFELDSPPVLDGLIAARNNLYLSTKRGSLVCFQARDAGEDERTSK